MADQEHIYTSELGENFTSFHNWCLEKLTPSELAIYEASVQNEAYLEIYQRWWVDQKIINHETFEDGVKISP